MEALGTIVERSFAAGHLNTWSICISLFDLSKFRISNDVVNTNIITAMVYQIWKDKNRKSRIDIAVVPATFYDLIGNGFSVRPI
jgi:hypothetical protein